jgi:hypothetical protein
MIAIMLRGFDCACFMDISILESEQKHICPKRNTLQISPDRAIVRLVLGLSVFGHSGKIVSDCPGLLSNTQVSYATTAEEKLK